MVVLCLEYSESDMNVAVRQSYKTMTIVKVRHKDNKSNAAENGNKMKSTRQCLRPDALAVVLFVRNVA